MDNFSPNTRFSVFPPVIKNLLIINALAFLATKSVFSGGWTPLGETLMPYLVLRPLGEGFMPWQLITYMFLHANLGHIFFNLFALWIFGQSIENLWGSKRFLIYYLLTGIGAAVIHMFIGGYFTYTLGASGAVYGILLAFGMMFPDKYIILLIPPIPIKAKYFVMIFGAIELMSGLTNPGSGVAHFAHLGGLLVGYILIKFWGIKKPEHYV